MKGASWLAFASKLWRLFIYKFPLLPPLQNGISQCCCCCCWLAVMRSAFHPCCGQ